MLASVRVCVYKSVCLTECVCVCVCLRVSQLIRKIENRKMVLGKL